MRKVFGKGINFAAQVNNTRKNLLNYQVIQQLSQVPIKSIGCGYLQSYYLLQNGQILKIGNIMDTVVNTRQVNMYRLTPKLLRLIQKFKFLGKTLSFHGGDQRLTTLNMQFLMKGVIPEQIEFGLTRMIFKDKNNKYYGIGQNYFGQLGTRDTLTLQHTIRQIYPPSNQQIKTVTCGFQHTIYLTQTGNIYGCGKADSYQIQPLNRKSQKTQLTVSDKYLEPSLLFKGRVNHVGCGFKHTIFSTEDNQVYSLGNNKYGQCGHSYKQQIEINKPRKLYFPLKKGQKIVDIKCGFNHSLVLTNERLYFFGSTEQNQNPFEKYNQNLSSPTIMRLSFKPIKIFSNFDRTCVIGSNGECIIFGGNKLSHLGGQNGEQVQDLSSKYQFSLNSLIGLGFGHTILYP